MQNAPHILIADDHSNIVNVLMRRLQDAGYHVLTALDGEEVLLQTERDMPDLLVLDVKMPKLDGYEVCQRLRHNQVTATIPVILCSGSSTEVSRLMDQTVQLGAVSWLHKPFTSEELLEHVRHALLHRGQEPHREQ